MFWPFTTSLLQPHNATGCFTDKTGEVVNSSKQSDLVKLLVFHFTKHVVKRSSSILGKFSSAMSVNVCYAHTVNQTWGGSMVTLTPRVWHYCTNSGKSAHSVTQRVFICCTHTHKDPVIHCIQQVDIQQSATGETSTWHISVFTISTSANHRVPSHF